MTNFLGKSLHAGTGGPKGGGQDGLRKGTKPSELGEIPEDWEVVTLGTARSFINGSGGTMLHVTNEKMESTRAAFPSYEEQTAIATILSDMDAEIQALDQRLSKTHQIKQGVMQELLTGKIRLIKPSMEVIHE